MTHILFSERQAIGKRADELMDKADAELAQREPGKRIDRSTATRLGFLLNAMHERGITIFKDKQLHDALDQSCLCNDGLCDNCNRVFALTQHPDKLKSGASWLI